MEDKQIILPDIRSDWGPDIDRMFGKTHIATRFEAIKLPDESWSVHVVYEPRKPTVLETPE